MFDRARRILNMMVAEDVTVSSGERCNLDQCHRIGDKRGCLLALGGGSVIES